METLDDSAEDKESPEASPKQETNPDDGSVVTPASAKPNLVSPNIKRRREDVVTESSPTKSWKRRRSSRIRDTFKEDFLYFDDSSDEEDANDFLPVSTRSRKEETKFKQDGAREARPFVTKVELVAPGVKTAAADDVTEPATRTNARTKANIVARLKWKTAHKHNSAASCSARNSLVSAEKKTETRNSPKTSSLSSSVHHESSPGKPRDYSAPANALTTPRQRSLAQLDDTLSDSEVPRTPILRTYSRADNNRTKPEQTPASSAKSQLNIVPLSRFNGVQSDQMKTTSDAPQVVSCMDDIIVSYDSLQSQQLPIRSMNKKRLPTNVRMN